MRRTLSLLVERIFIPVVLLFGAAARITTWIQDRSLFIDEANLARNICEKRWTEFFGALSYEQYSPPFFSIICKLFIQIFGNSEMSLRGFPLICGLVSLALFYYVAKQVISNSWVLLFTVWIFSFSEMQVRYSTECKQYICDVTVSLGIVAYILWQIKHGFRLWPSVFLGIIVPWFSMPAIFILAGGGIVLLVNTWVTKDRRSLIRVFSVGIIWIINFALYYVSSLQGSIKTDSLIQYHQSYFIPLLPSTQQEWLKAIGLIKSFPYNTAGYTVLALISGSVGILIGIIYSFRKNISQFLLLVLPVFLCIVASGLELYSLVPRMILWAFTLLLLVQGIGWQWLIARLPNYLFPITMLLLISPAGLQSGYKVFYHPLQIEEIRPVLDNITTNFQENDYLYVHHEAWPAFAYYSKCFADREKYQFGKRIIQGMWHTKPEQQVIMNENRRVDRVWLVYSHVISESTGGEVESDLHVIDTYAHRIDSIVAPGAIAYLYQF